MRSTLTTLALLCLVLAAPVGAVADAGAAPAEAPRANDAGVLAQADCSFPYTATDATGTEVRIPQDPGRIVTLAPSAAQTMWEIGARDEVVGVSKHARYLEGAREKANVSQGFSVNVEQIVGLEPDLVLAPNVTASTYADQIATLREAGIPVYVFHEATSLSFVVEKTRLTGRLTGNCEGADARATAMQENLTRVRGAVDETIGDGERPAGLYYTYGFTAGKETFVDSIMATGGLDNAAPKTGFYEISAEAVVEADPDWLVLGTDVPVPRNETFNTTTALQRGQIVRVNTDYLNQPAPRTIRAVATIVRTVHPEAWAAVRASQETTTTTTTATPTTTTTTATPTTTTTTTATPTTTTATPTTTESTGQPGFGAALALVALLGAALLAARPS